MLRLDQWLQRLAAIATIVGVPIAIAAMILGWWSLDAGIKALQYQQSQFRPQLDVSGHAQIAREPEKTNLEVVIVNKESMAASDVSVHLEALFRDQSRSTYLGQLVAVQEFGRGSKTFNGVNVARTFTDMLRRAIRDYDPRVHGPSQVIAYLEYRDAGGVVWGGRDESGRDRRGMIRRHLKTEWAE